MASQSIVAHGETVRVSGVSLLFCDLVGSTALLAELGEEANDQVRRDLFEVSGNLSQRPWQRGQESR